MLGSSIDDSTRFRPRAKPFSFDGEMTREDLEGVVSIAVSDLARMEQQIDVEAVTERFLLTVRTSVSEGDYPAPDRTVLDLVASPASIGAVVAHANRYVDEDEDYSDEPTSVRMIRPVNGYRIETALENAAISMAKAQEEPTVDGLKQAARENVASIVAFGHDLLPSDEDFRVALNDVRVKRYCDRVATAIARVNSNSPRAV